MGSETLPSACYMLSDESSIPFYSTSNGYKNNEIGTLWKWIAGTPNHDDSIKVQNKIDGLIQNNNNQFVINSKLRSDELNGYNYAEEIQEIYKHE